MELWGFGGTIFRTEKAIPRASKDASKCVASAFSSASNAAESTANPFRQK